MSNKGQKKVQVFLVCEECGDIAPIWRFKARTKEPRHKKHMWCPVCLEVTKHIERKDW